MPCVTLKVGDRCDACGEGTMRPTGRKARVDDESGRPKERSEELRCDACDHQHVNLGLFEYVGMGDSLGLKVKEPGKSRPVIETKVAGKKEHRFSRKPSGMIQLAWKDAKFTHIHCKVCDNSWKVKESPTHEDKFEVTKRSDGVLLVKCMKCGRTYESG